ncbi:hypothetical protein DXG01_003416 [Tephrocybe rancida]|nr:hypothetical protein DXG01_003416 [Tephrocybe rancida]
MSGQDFYPEAHPKPIPTHGYYTENTYGNAEPMFYDDGTYGMTTCSPPKVNTKTLSYGHGEHPALIKYLQSMRTEFLTTQRRLLLLCITLMKMRRLSCMEKITSPPLCRHLHLDDGLPALLGKSRPLTSTQESPLLQIATAIPNVVFPA